MGMDPRVLFVDDDRFVLDGMRRILRDKYDAEFAEGPEIGLAALQSGPFAVVVSDMMMPNMNGAQFLAAAAEIQPEAVQMILSGQADLTSTVAAVNDGNLFRFLTKPVDRDALVVALDAALAQYRLRRAEQELLEQTLTGSIDALSDILAMANPQSARRATLIRQLVEKIATPTEFRDDWQLRIAAMVASIGLVSVPDDVVARSCAAAVLSSQEVLMMRRHPEVAAQVLSHIPRLDTVAEIVMSQHTAVSSLTSGTMTGRVAVMQLATDIADRVLKGSTEEHAIAVVRASGNHADVLFEGLEPSEGTVVLRELKPIELRPGMILENDLLASTGALIAIAGTTLTVPMLERIKNFATGTGVREPIVVRIRRRRPAVAA